MNNNTLPFRELYVFPQEKKPKTVKKSDTKHLIIGLGLNLIAYTFVFGCLMYTKEPKWFCMTVATLIGQLTSTVYWIKNVFNEPTDYKTNSVDNKPFNSSYIQHGFVRIKQSF